MTGKRSANSDRLPLTDEELAQLTAYDFVKVKLTEEEKVRLRAINERRRQESEHKAANWRNAEQPLVEELRAAGFDVDSAWDLFNRKEPWNKKERITPYLEALPILLKHLERTYPERVREGIARALAVRREGWAVAPAVDFRLAWETLIRLYCKEEANTDAKQGLAVAISEMADDEMIAEVIGLVKDARNGPSRVLLLSVLEQSSDPRSRATLMELGTDPELSKEIQAILRRRR